MTITERIITGILLLPLAILYWWIYSTMGWRIALGIVGTSLIILFFGLMAQAGTTPYHEHR